MLAKWLGAPPQLTGASKLRYRPVDGCPSLLGLATETGSHQAPGFCSDIW